MGDPAVDPNLFAAQNPPPPVFPGMPQRDRAVAPLLPVMPSGGLIFTFGQAALTSHADIIRAGANVDTDAMFATARAFVLGATTFGGGYTTGMNVNPAPSGYHYVGTEFVFDLMGQSLAYPYVVRDGAGNAVGVMMLFGTSNVTIRVRIGINVPD